MLRVVQVGLGPVGRQIVTDLHRRELGRVVAAVDPAPELVGQPLSDLVPGSPSDVTVSATLDGIDDWDSIRCALVTSRSDLEQCMDTFRTILARGIDVVSTCEELSWPWLRHPVLAQELHELSVRGGARIVGAGVNPGFLMDTLPVASSTMCHEVRGVEVERVQDAAPRRLPFQRKIGAGLTTEAFEQRVAEGTLRHVGLGESLHFVAHYLGFELERWEESIEPVIADEPLECGLGPIEVGCARGVRQIARGWAGGREVVTLVFHAAVGEPEPRDRIRVDGEPPLELVLPGGVHGDVATSAVVLNTIRSLRSAPAGLHTMASLPLQGCATGAE